MKKKKDRPSGLVMMSELIGSFPKQLNFCCPKCGGRVLSHGQKSYVKADVVEDGQLLHYGEGNLDESQSDFACHKCGLIISQGKEPIRTVADMIAWLKANCEQEDS